MPPSTASSSGVLITDCWTPTNPQPIMPAEESQVSNYKGWCSNIVVLHVMISAQEIVQNTYTELTDVPLAIRTAHAAAAYRAQVAEQRRKQEVERSKAVTPTL